MAEDVGANHRMSAIGGNQHVALRHVPPFKPGPHAAVELFNTCHSLTKADIGTPVSIHQHVLQLRARHRIRAFAHTFD
ncbi:hypothetical protein D3C75_928900 [compost metagenome]